MPSILFRIRYVFVPAFGRRINFNITFQSPPILILNCPHSWNETERKVLKQFLKLCQVTWCTIQHPTRGRIIGVNHGDGGYIPPKNYGGEMAILPSPEYGWLIGQPTRLQHAFLNENKKKTCMHFLFFLHKISVLHPFKNKYQLRGFVL